MMHAITLTTARHALDARTLAALEAGDPHTLSLADVTRLADHAGRRVDCAAYLREHGGGWIVDDDGHTHWIAGEPATQLEDEKTWLQPEKYAYPHGGLTRRGRARIAPNPHNPVALPYGEIRAVRAGIADTAFTVPARLRYRGTTIRGYLSIDTDTETLTFTPYADPDHCQTCAPGQGCRRP